MPAIEDDAPAANHLINNIVRFCRLLRVLGMDTGPDRAVDLIRAIQMINVGSRTDFYHATRALLVSRKEDITLFDAAFDLFWRIQGGGSHRQSVTVSGTLPRPARPVILPPSSSDRASQDDHTKRDPAEKQEPPAVEMTATYSAREALRHKDFAEMTPEELTEVKAAITNFVWQLGERRTRRMRPGGNERIDMRRTLRLNLRYGGEIVEWATRRPLFKPRPLILIADISGSMDRYVRLLMRFCYSMARSLRQPVEAFVFGTQLTCITRQLRTRDVDAALADVGRRVPDWSGGTRIGDALKTFNFGWGQRVLRRGAVTILISDGWDCGDAGVLAREMGRLRRTSYRLIWLNPLLGSPQYEPLTYGMRAALPYVHDFLPVHNLVSLEMLADHLASLGKQPGSRSDYARRAF